jgi:hypothetical protein
MKITLLSTYVMKLWLNILSCNQFIRNPIMLSILFGKICGIRRQWRMFYPLIFTHSEKPGTKYTAEFSFIHPFIILTNHFIHLHALKLYNILLLKFNLKLLLITISNKYMF